MSKHRRKFEDGSKPSIHVGVYIVTGFFLLMFFTICALSLFYNGTLPFSLPKFIDPNGHYGIFRRRLTEDCYPEAYDPEVNVIWAILGVMYIFIGLAIVCDEFFVPALEIIADKLNLTPDVAGATLMAAGGSAPELFTNVFATFEESDAGFGTIIGSAVFNVLFVIGMCAMFSKETLHLTWWPLARDCIFYTIGLCIVAILIGANTRNEIEMWEAIVLFVLYFAYIYLMLKNEKLKDWVFSKFGLSRKLTKLEEPQTSYRSTSKSVREDSPDIMSQGTKMIGRKLSLRGTNFRVPGTFRVGIQHLMLKDYTSKSWVSTKAVLDMAGNVKDTFDKLDTNKDGKLDEKELGALLKDFSAHLDQEVEAVPKLMKELDKNQDGFVGREEFTNWYIFSQDRIKADINNLFDKFDKDQNEKLSRSEVSQLLRFTKKMEEDDINETVEKLFENKNKGDGVTRDQFFLWYDASDLYELHKKDTELQRNATQGFEQFFEFPTGHFQQVWWFLTLPYTLAFWCTMVDVRQINRQNYCWFVFIISIVWIGGFSYVMVTLAMGIGDTLKIPNYIMGMTFLAAGTSIPDLLSSVIVARQGHGDMAVSSSIGSNIFDILVGLPLPWILYILIKGKRVKMYSCELAVSIIVLMCMLIAVITAIKISGWEMSKCLGYSMFVLYFVFLTQDLARNFSGDACGSSCD